MQMIIPSAINLLTAHDSQKSLSCLPPACFVIRIKCYVWTETIFFNDSISWIFDVNVIYSACPVHFRYHIMLFNQLGRFIFVELVFPLMFVYIYMEYENGIWKKTNKDLAVLAFLFLCCFWYEVPLNITILVRFDFRQDHDTYPEDLVLRQDLVGENPSCQDLVL